MFKSIKKIFSVSYENNHKVFTIFGIKIKCNCLTAYNNSLSQSLILDLKTQIMAQKINYNLKKYKNCNNNKSIVVIGGGETLKYYENPSNSNDNIFVGLNRAYKIKDINFDYLFCQDRFDYVDETTEFINYNPDNCKKFIGHITIPNTPYRYRINKYVEIKNGELYILDNKRMGEIPLNITIEPFADLCGTVFSALQFLIYTNPKKIYLYGFDCNVSHLFETDPAHFDLSYQYASWLKIKDFIDNNTLNIEIISVNPVGLKGLFRDVYTQSFVDAHPELLKENIEIINEDTENI